MCVVTVVFERLSIGIESDQMWNKGNDLHMYWMKHVKEWHAFSQNGARLFRESEKTPKTWSSRLNGYWSLFKSTWRDWSTHSTCCFWMGLSMWEGSFPSWKTIAFFFLPVLTTQNGREGRTIWSCPSGHTGISVDYIESSASSGQQTSSRSSSLVWSSTGLTRRSHHSTGQSSRLSLANHITSERLCGRWT